MYLAVWIDETQQAPCDKIVLCKPLFSRLNAAVAVLNSVRHADADFLILSGDVGRFNTLAEMLDRVIGEEDGDLVTRVSDLAKRLGLSVVSANGGGPEPAFAKVTKSPSPKLYPRYITPGARKIWDDVVVRYRDVIERYGPDKEREWAAALVLFRRVSMSMGVEPFTKQDPAQQKSRMKQQNEIRKRVNRGNHEALKSVVRAFELLKQSGLGSVLIGEKFYESNEQNGRFYIVTYQVVKVPSGKSSRDGIEKLLDVGWGGGQVGRYVHRVVDSYTDVLVEPTKPQELWFYVTTHLTRDQLVVLFDMEENATPQEIMRMLSKSARRWVRTGTLTKVSGWSEVMPGGMLI